MAKLAAATEDGAGGTRHTQSSIRHSHTPQAKSPSELLEIGRIKFLQALEQCGDGKADEWEGPERANWERG